jgi:hypothetical protein
MDPATYKASRQRLLSVRNCCLRPMLFRLCCASLRSVASLRGDYLLPFDIEGIQRQDDHRDHAQRRQRAFECVSPPLPVTQRRVKPGKVSSSRSAPSPFSCKRR